MPRAKVAISLDESTLERLDNLVERAVFSNRSQAIQEAVEEKRARMERSRLVRECAKLDPTFKRALAEEGMAEDATESRILRGEIRWADLNPTRGKEQTGQRPVLILSQDVFNDRSGTVIAVALTSQPQVVSGASDPARCAVPRRTGTPTVPRFPLAINGRSPRSPLKAILAHDRLHSLSAP